MSLELSTLASDIEQFIHDEIGFTPIEKVGYKPHISSLKDHSYEYIERIFNKMGARENTCCNSSLKIKKIVSLSAAVGLFSSLCFLSAAPLAFGAAAGGVISTIIFASFYFKYELTDLSSLERLRKDVTTWKLEKIRKNFSFDELLGYDLLKYRLEFYTKEEKAHIYAHIKDLFSEIEQKEKEVGKHSFEIERISHQYREKIKALEIRKVAIIRSAAYLMEGSVLSTLSQAAKDHLYQLAEGYFSHKYQSVLNDLSTWRELQRNELNEFKLETNRLVEQRYEAICENDLIK